MQVQVVQVVSSLFWVVWQGNNFLIAANCHKTLRSPPLELERVTSADGDGTQRQLRGGERFPSEHHEADRGRHVQHRGVQEQSHRESDHSNELTLGTQLVFEAVLGLRAEALVEDHTE